ncbi:MAG: hypothetical protein JNJ46_19470 [Myxococcales bacterium]|nr:hypothetical protein [Myxococcales bacterium]
MPITHRDRLARSLLLSLFVAVSQLLPGSASAQQAIVTLPSADITEPRVFFAMKESQLRAWGQKPMWNATFFLTYGIGYHTELAATFFNIGVPRTDHASVALGSKSALPLFTDALPSLDIKLTAGAMGLVSLDGKGLGHWLYTHLSLRLPRLATRISAGISQGSAVLFLQEHATSFIAAIEQPIPGLHGLTVTAEWFSGSHDLSNLIIGAAYHPSPRWIFVLGYKIPTKDREITVEEQALVGEVGFFFR